MTKRILTILVSLLITPSLSLAAIAYDNAGVSGVSGSVTTYSYTYTVSTLNNTYILCSEAHGYGSINMTSMKDNGVEMTKLFEMHDTAGSNNTSFYGGYIMATTTGNNIITVTVSSATSIAIGCQSYTGVNPSLSYGGASPTDATSTKQLTGSTNPTVTNSLTTLTDNSWVLTPVFVNAVCAAAPVASTNVTRRAASSWTCGPSVGDNNGVVTPAGALSQTWSTSSGNDGWQMAQISISPYVAAAASTFQLWSYSLF